MHTGADPVDYEESFDESRLIYCIHLKNDGFGGLKVPVISKSFRRALESNCGKDLIYEHYICSICELPSKFYVRFCWFCENDFFGISTAEKCTPCKRKGK